MKTMKKKQVWLCASCYMDLGNSESIVCESCLDLEVLSLIDNQISWHAGSRGIPNSVKGHDFVFNGIFCFSQYVHECEHKKFICQSQ